MLSRRSLQSMSEPPAMACSHCTVVRAAGRHSGQHHCAFLKAHFHGNTRQSQQRYILTLALAAVRFCLDESQAPQCSARHTTSAITSCGQRPSKASSTCHSCRSGVVRKRGARSTNMPRHRHPSPSSKVTRRLLNWRRSFRQYRLSW